MPTRLALEIGRRDPAALGIVNQKRMRQRADHHRGKQHQRFAMCLGLQVSHDRQLGDVVLQMAHDIFERRVRHFHVGEIEDYAPNGLLPSLMPECWDSRPAGFAVSAHRVVAHIFPLSPWRRRVFARDNSDA